MQTWQNVYVNKTHSLRTHMFTRVHMCTFLCTHMCVYTHVHVHMCVYTCVHCHFLHFFIHACFGNTILADFSTVGPLKPKLFATLHSTHLRAPSGLSFSPHTSSYSLHLSSSFNTSQLRLDLEGIPSFYPSSSSCSRDCCIWSDTRCGSDRSRVPY